MGEEPETDEKHGESLLFAVFAVVSSLLLAEIARCCVLSSVVVVMCGWLRPARKRQVLPLSS